MYGYTTKTKTK